MLRIDPWCFYFAAVLVLTVPINWLVAAALAAGFHELCHIGVIQLLGEEIHQITISPRGMVLSVSFRDDHRELVAALAGPLGSFFLLIFSRIWPQLAICAFVQGAFNLLPLYPLDGGRILACLLRLFLHSLRKIPCKGRKNRVQ